MKMIKMRKFRISLKASAVAVKILLIPFSIGYIFVIIPNEQADIIFGVIGFIYFCAIYILANHLFIRGAIKMKGVFVFWIAFFLSIIPIVHLITPLYLLKKSSETLRMSDGKHV